MWAWIVGSLRYNLSSPLHGSISMGPHVVSWGGALQGCAAVRQKKQCGAEWFPIVAAGQKMLTCRRELDCQRSGWRPDLRISLTGCAVGCSDCRWDSGVEEEDGKVCTCRKGRQRPGPKMVCRISIFSTIRRKKSPDSNYAECSGARGWRHICPCPLFPNRDDALKSVAQSLPGWIRPVTLD